MARKAKPTEEAPPLALDAEIVEPGGEKKIELDLPVNPEPAPSAGLMTVATPTPMILLQKALDNHADLAVIEKLMDLRDRDDARRAKMEFDAAFAKFKAEAIQIVKNVSVNDGPLKGKKYADLSAVVEAATPALSKNGFGISWKLTKDEKDWMEVTCFLRHEGGHVEQTSMGGPPDAGGAKNPIQARGSTKSYLERYTFLAITGLAAKGEDTDGNIPLSDVLDDLKLIAIAPNNDALFEVYSKAYRRAEDARDKAAMSELIKAKDARKLELHKGGAK